MIIKTSVAENLSPYNIATSRRTRPPRTVTIKVNPPVNQVYRIDPITDPGSGHKQQIG